MTINFCYRVHSRPELESYDLIGELQPLQSNREFRNRRGQQSRVHQNRSSPLWGAPPPSLFQTRPRTLSEFGAEYSIVSDRRAPRRPTLKSPRFFPRRVMEANRIPSWNQLNGLQNETKRTSNLNFLGGSYCVSGRVQSTNVSQFMINFLPSSESKVRILDLSEL